MPYAISFVQFKKCEKYPHGIPSCRPVQMVPNCAKHLNLFSKSKPMFSLFPPPLKTSENPVVYNRKIGLKSVKNIALIIKNILQD